MECTLNYRKVSAEGIAFNKPQVVVFQAPTKEMATLQAIPLWWRLARDNYAVAFVSLKFGTEQLAWKPIPIKEIME